MRAKMLKEYSMKRETKRERNARAGADNSISGKRSSLKSVADLGHWFEAC